MDNLVISHMNAKVLKHLEGYASDPGELRDALSDYMKSLGVTPSQHTVAVLEYLFRNRTHPSADKIYKDLQSEVGSLTRTALNSTLEVLSQLGAIQIIHLDTYESRYDGDTTPHAHLICAKCGDVTDIPLTGNVSKMISAPTGATIDDIQLMCLGMCAKCNGYGKNVN